jgi:AbiJ N-terminal domain 4
MALPPTFSRRKRQSQRSGPDAYDYDIIPPKLRVQVIHVLTDTLGALQEVETGETFKEIVEFLRKEFGVFDLGHACAGPRVELFNWFQTEPETDRWLDGYELCLRIIDRHLRENWSNLKYFMKSSPDEAIAELNARFQEAAVGYQYISGEIIRIDSLLLHKELIVPVIILLSNPMFAAAEKEYREAHEAYRHRRFEDCIVACGKAFESVLKVIGAKRKWA